MLLCRTLYLGLMRVLVLVNCFMGLSQCMPRAAIYDCIQGQYFGPHEVSAETIACLAKIGLTPKAAAYFLSRKREQVTKRSVVHVAKRNEIPIPVTTGKADQTLSAPLGSGTPNSHLTPEDFGYSPRLHAGNSDDVLGKTYPLGVECYDRFPDPSIKVSEFKPQIDIACGALGKGYESKIKALPPATGTSSLAKPTASGLEIIPMIITGSANKKPYKLYMSSGDVFYNGDKPDEWATSLCKSSMSVLTRNVQDQGIDSKCVYSGPALSLNKPLATDAPKAKRADATSNEDAVILGGKVFVIADEQAQKVIASFGLRAGGDHSTTPEIEIGPSDLVLDINMDSNLEFETIDEQGNVKDHNPGAFPPTPDWLEKLYTNEQFDPYDDVYPEGDFGAGGDEDECELDLTENEPVPASVKPSTETGVPFSNGPVLAEWLRKGGRRL